MDISKVAGMFVPIRQPLQPTIRFDQVPAPLPPVPDPVASKPKRRDSDLIWELSPNLHCSVIGTCLTTGELRQLLAKLGDADAKTTTSHAVHHRAVVAAGRGDVAGKLLDKILERKQESFVRRLGRVTTRDEVAGLWRAALDAGDIPGAYWATMTHPLTDGLLVREAFGEVHMLSHLVGTSMRVRLFDRLSMIACPVDAIFLCKLTNRFPAGRADQRCGTGRSEADHQLPTLPRHPVDSSLPESSRSACA